MRVVLDTNILISACLKPGGLEAQTVQLARSRAFTLCVSPAVLAEYTEVLARDKFRSVREQSAEILASLPACAMVVETESVLHHLKDDDDNRLLECASAAGAAYLVTGNLKHFPDHWECARIVNARTFLEAEFSARCSQ